MINVLLFLLFLYLPFRLAWDPPQWSLPWWNGLISWLSRQGWNTCGHPQTVIVRDHTPEGIMTMRTMCETCYATLLTISDTEAHWQQEAQRHQRSEPFRRFLDRWVVSPLREYCRFCACIGGILVSTVLVYWLTYRLLGVSFTETIYGSLPCPQLSDTVKGQP